MNKTQKAYAVAKANYEATIAMMNEELKAIDHLIEEDYDLYDQKYNELDAKYNSYELFKVLRNAENEMIAWANENVSKSKHFTAAHKEAIAEIMANIHRVGIRSKMVDLAFRLG